MNSTRSELNHGRNYRMAILRSLLVCVLLLTGGFAAGIAVERKMIDEDAPDTYADLTAVSGIIDEYYYYQPTSDEGKAEMDADMEVGAIEGALLTLDDSYTRYLDVNESLTAQESLEGSYGGIGVDVTIDAGLVVVTMVVPGSPADDAGISRGDVIEQINGDRPPVTEVNDVVRLLRGEIGSTVTVTLIRPTTGDVLHEELTLEEIVVPPVTLEYLEGGTIAWIRITLFGDTTVADLDAAIADIRQSDAQGVIVDLRGNGGGWVEAARETLGRFLDPAIGPAMYEDTEPGEGGIKELPIQAGEGIEPLDLPMVVLVDGSTASSAEIVAGALKDYDRAIIVGENTFGKGSVQSVFRFSNGSTMRVTVAEWFTPSMGRIQNEGIRPHVVASTGVSVESTDPVLDAGIVVLMGAIAGDDNPIGTPEASPAAVREEFYNSPRQI